MSDNLSNEYHQVLEKINPSFQISICLEPLAIGYLKHPLILNPDSRFTYLITTLNTKSNFCFN